MSCTEIKSTVLVRPFPDDVVIIQRIVKCDFLYSRSLEFEDALISTVNRPDGTVAFIAITLPYSKEERLKKELAKAGAPVSYLK